MSDTDKKVKPAWESLHKVPADAGPYPRAHPTRGVPKGQYPYYDRDGDLVGVMCDFVTSTGEALQLQLAWCEDRSPLKKAPEWRWKWFPALRPLYNLVELINRPQADVVLLPDEYSAHVFSELFPDAVGTTWAGGIKHLDETEFSILRGRSVTCWLPAGAERYKVSGADPLSNQIKPLRLQKWFGASVSLSETLVRLDARATFVLFKPGEKPDNWCFREARAEGMSAEDVRFVLFGAQTLSASSAEAIAYVLDAPAEPISPPKPAAAAGDEHTQWAARLIRNREDDAILPELANVRLVMANHADWRDVIAEDVFAHRIMKRTKPPFERSGLGEWSDNDDIDAHVWLTTEMHMLRVKTTDVTKAVLSIGARNAYNPLTDFLEQCETLWKKDARPRVDTWLQTYLGAGGKIDENMTAADIAAKEQLDEYISLVGRVCLIGACKRAFYPGCQFDYVLILEGEQGKGKSSAIGILGGEWAMDTPFDFHGKEGIEAIQGKWIVEMAELDSFSKSENTTAKSFLPRKVDRFRLPYGKRSKDFPRSCIFAGTTNEGEYFRDPTGNRRYHPVYCHHIDRDMLARDRMLLLGEAVVRMKKGERVFPTPAEEDRLVKPEQEKRMINDFWIEKIGDYLIGKSSCTMTDILEGPLALDAGKVDESRAVARVGRCMRKLGWEKKDLGSTRHSGRFIYVKKDSYD